MITRSIWNLHSDKPTPSRFCDAIIESGEVKLRVKLDRDRYETIPWKDVVYQIEDLQTEALKTESSP